MTSSTARSERLPVRGWRDIRFELGNATLSRSPRVAVLAQWSTRPRMTKSFCTLVHELQSFGYRVVVCSASADAGSLEWDDSVDETRLIVLRRRNLGYDFGSWRAALALLPELVMADKVLLANDSMAGPFASLGGLLADFDRTTADVWSLTDSSQLDHHLQSYFLGFDGGVLRERPVRAFFAGVRHETNKRRIIIRNEIGLSQLLRQEGFALESAFPHQRFVKRGQNPVILGWRRLLEAGFPFLKREILRDASVAPDGSSARVVIRSLFGIDVNAWVDDVSSEETASG